MTPRGLKITAAELMLMMVLLAYGAAVAAERMAVAVPKANVRAGPGKQYDVIWNVEKYYPVIVIAKQNSWYRFRDFEGDEGFVHKSLLTRGIETVVTVKQICNVRSGPGTSFAIAFTVEQGVPFKVLRRKGNWISVQHADGDKGWIYKTLTW